MQRLIENQADIGVWLAGQSDHVRLAVAFWGSGAIESLRLDKIDANVSILLDLTAGASNPDEVERLMLLFPKRVRMVARLHAKAWIGDRQMIVGSANASANGLGFEADESRHWKELGVLVAQPGLVERAKYWFDGLWHLSKVIGRSDMDAARKQWRLRRKERPLMGSGGSLLDAVASSPDYFRDRRIFVAVTSTEISTSADDELSRLSKLAGKEIHAFEDWDEIPTSATLISFICDDGICEFDKPTIYSTEDQVSAGRLQFVHPRSRVLGYSRGEIKAWRKRLSVLRRKFPEKWNDGDMAMELVEFIGRTG